MKKFIELSNVSKVYKSDGVKYSAIDNISFGIDKGEFVVIKGKSGSGKSTLLNMIAGIDKPTQGRIKINEVHIDSMTSDELTNLRGNNIGVVFQFFQLMPTLTVLENVILPMELSDKIPSKHRKEKGLDLLRKMDISHLADKFPNSISGGEKQRAAIARALANDPEMIIADEPTGNLDSENASAIHKMFKKLNEEGKTIIYVTHEKDISFGNARQLIIEDGMVRG